MLARAWLAFVLSYLLGLNPVIVAAAPIDADGTGIICVQGRSAPNQHKDHGKGHGCCLAARCGLGTALSGPPAQPFVPLVRHARLMRRAIGSPDHAAGIVAQSEFRARAPPSSA